MPIDTKTYKHYWTDKKWWQDEDYVEFPVLTYKKHYARTKTVERKIKSLLRIAILTVKILQKWRTNIFSQNVSYNIFLMFFFLNFEIWI